MLFLYLMRFLLLVKGIDISLRCMEEYKEDELFRSLQKNSVIYISCTFLWE